MIDQDKAPMSGQAINVGIYGCTKAGKTRFLFQLLNCWERTRRLLGQSEACQKFLANVESEIEKHHGSMPTVAMIEGIKVKVRRDGDEAPLELVFRDLRGELLSGELDQIASLNRNGLIPTQVRKCDAFLFFFDPASSENPADIDKHHQRELKRAALFIEYVLKVRENRHLPIVFLQTHLDRWEHDADVRAKAERWVNDVHAKLVELYDSGLRRLYPKSIVDRHRIAFSVSSVGKTQEADKHLEKVVEQLNDLVADSAAHRCRLQKSSLYALVAGVVVLPVLAFVIWLLSSMGGSPPQSKKGDDRIVVAEMPDQEINAKLDELDRLLKAHPRGVQLPGVEEAKKINHHLRWLAQRLEPDSGGMTGVSEKTQQRMRSALDSVGKLVQEKAESKGHAPAALTRVLNAYLEDLPDMTPTSAALAQAQAHYWQLQRAHVVEEVAGTLKRHHEVASPPIDTLGEVVSRLGGFEQEVARCKVFAPQVPQDPYQDMRKALVEEIKTAVTFCETRRTSKTYATTIRITGSLNIVDDRWRNIRLQSPGQSDDYSRNGINLKPVTDDERTSFNTKQSEYLVMLGLGTPVKLLLAVHDGQQHDGAAKWTQVKDFDVTENRDERSPLEPLGLPLHSRDKVTKRLQADGHDLEITFLDFSPVPALLWETAGSAKERTP